MISSLDRLLPVIVLCIGGMGCGEEGTSGAQDADARDNARARTAKEEQRATTSPPLLATSPSHSCALIEAGLFCWGQNFSGQLGTGDLVDSDTAMAAKVARADVAQVALSTGRTCVRHPTGKVSCWGINELGQRGDGTRVETLGATTAVGVDDAVELAIDDQTTCVVRGAARSVSCWGGLTGDAPVGPAPQPTPIADVSGVVELRAGVNGEYCSRLQDESVRCWSLQEGGWTAAANVPRLKGARGIAMAGFGEVCALFGSGPIQCHNLTNGKTVPLDRSTGKVRILGAGSLAACAVSGEGTWHCWNVLPPLLELVGSPRLDAVSPKPLVDLVFSGFRVCALHPGNEVACGEVTDWKLPELVRVEGLPI